MSAETDVHTGGNSWHGAVPRRARWVPVPNRDCVTNVLVPHREAARRTVLAVTIGHPPTDNLTTLGEAEGDAAVCRFEARAPTRALQSDIWINMRLEPLREMGPVRNLELTITSKLDFWVPPPRGQPSPQSLRK